MDDWKSQEELAHYGIPLTTDLVSRLKNEVKGLDKKVLEWEQTYGHLKHHSGGFAYRLNVPNRASIKFNLNESGASDETKYVPWVFIEFDSNYAKQEVVPPISILLSEKFQIIHKEILEGSHGKIAYRGVNIFDYDSMEHHFNLSLTRNFFNECSELFRLLPQLGEMGNAHLLQLIDRVSELYKDKKLEISFGHRAGGLAGLAHIVTDY